MLPRVGDGAGERTLLPTGSVAQALESSALIALTSAGVVTALSDPLGSGGRSLPGKLLSFNPARPSTARLTGEMPPSREGDRYVFGLRPQAQQLHPACLPSS